MSTSFLNAYQSDLSGRAEAVCLIAAFLLAALLYGAGMSRAGFEGKDERRYAQTAKEITPGAGLFVMRYLGELYPDKPPLFFWAEALSFRALGGVSPFAARLPLFVSALAALAFAYLCLRQIDGPRVALIGMAALALSFRFLWAGRWVKLDMPMLTFTFAAFWCSARILFPRAGQTPAGAKWAAGAWIFCALAGLAKGPGALVWIGVILCYGLWRRDWAGLKRHRALWGAPLALAVVGLWFVPATILGGMDYIGPMIGVHVVERFAGAVRHEQPVWYFAKVLYESLPMGLLFIAAAWWAWKRRNDAADGGRSVFVLSWVFFTLIFFSVPSGKRGQYILPMYAGEALMVARFLCAALAGGAQEDRIVRRHLWIMAAGLALIGAPMAAVPPGMAEDFFQQVLKEYPVLPPRSLWTGIGLTFLLGGVAGILALRRHRTGWAAAACGSSFYGLYILLFAVFFPMNRDDSIVRQVAEISARMGWKGGQLGLYGVDDRLTLYGEGLPKIIEDQVEAQEFLFPGANRGLIVTERRLRSLREAPELPLWKEIGRWPHPEAKARGRDGDLILFVYDSISIESADAD